MDGTVDQAVLGRVIRRVVQVAQPEKIILFGSAVHGRMGPHSDLDLLIVRGGVDALDLMGDIYLNLRGVGAAVDAIVASPDDLERYRDSHGMIIHEALKEGRVVYEAARAIPARRPPASCRTGPPGRWLGGRRAVIQRVRKRVAELDFFIADGPRVPGRWMPTRRVGMAS